MHVSLDGSQAYTTIQTAIDDAQSGDVVLVHPGRYIENINLSNKQNIILASMEYTTGDTTYVGTTIIDGSSSINSTVLFYENAVNITLRGFSITGGYGYEFYNNPNEVFGGGIFVYLNNSVILCNLNVYNNKSSMGGGISILSTNSVSLSSVNIHNNVSRYMAGGLHIGSSPQNGAPTVTFSQTERCSIYNNFAQWGMDIHWHYIHNGTVSIYLKKFTVPGYERYYADYFDAGYDTSPYAVFDVQEAYLQPVDADIYVSPMGSDANDGLSPATALKTPSLGMQRIASNPNNPHTVHLLDGEHHNVMMGEYIPIAIKDYTTLKGVSESQTRLYAEELIQGTGVITMGIRCYGIRLFDLSITSSMASAIFGGGFDGQLCNVTIENCSTNKLIVQLGNVNSSFSLQNITMKNNTAFHYGFGMNIMGAVIKMDNIVIRDSRVPSYNPYWYQRGFGAFDIAVRDSLIISNSKFINNTHYSEDGFANYRISSGPQLAPIIRLDNCLFANNTTSGGARDIDIFYGYSSDIINCTFANNTGTYPDYMLMGTNTNRFVNCIFSNNSNSYDIRTTDQTLIENCLFSKSTNMYRVYNDASLTWGSSNIIGADPLFVGGEPENITYYYLCADDDNGYSPAIDAGTISSYVFPQGYSVPIYDAFGNPRIYGSGIDIGCYESQGYTGIEGDVSLPVSSLLLTNYPNPFNPSTTINYNVPADGNVTLNVYNAKGQLVNTLVSEHKNKGNYQVVWTGKDSRGNSVASGLYFTRLVSGGKSISKKMLLMK